MSEILVLSLGAQGGGKKRRMFHFNTKSLTKTSLTDPYEQILLPVHTLRISVMTSHNCYVQDWLLRLCDKGMHQVR